MAHPHQIGRIIAVGGGKGGVGKSLVSTNLAVALTRTGAQVVMLDADLGAPNLHTMFGIMRPQRTVADFLAGRVATLEELAIPTLVPGLRLICGAEGALGAANPTFQSKQKLLTGLGKLTTDCLLIDCGAGVDLNTIDFFNAADSRLIVMVPEITSLQNGYGFLKIALFRRLQRAAAGLKVTEQVNNAFGNEAFEIGSTMDKVSTFFSLLEDEVPDLVVQFRLLLQEFNARLIGNMLHKPDDRNALFAMQRIISERLNIPVEVAAGLRQNAAVRNSVNTGRPFAVDAPKTDPDYLELIQLATRLMQQDLAPIRKIREDFLRAMNRRPLDPNLDRRFQFGLEGIDVAAQPAPVTSAPPAVPSEPKATPSAPVAPGFESEFRQLQRGSERMKVQLPVELNFDGRWYLGRMVEINEGGASITGIRAPSTWAKARGTLREAGGAGNAPGIPIALHPNATPTNLIVRFEDAAAAAGLVAELRKRQRP